MANIRQPIVKLSRKLGIALGKEKWVQRRPYPPGVHGPKKARRRPRLSSFGEQLLEKQKARAVYNVRERQFSNYVKAALAMQGNTSDLLVQLLERRLDNVIYRLGFAKTRRQARQMVSHRFFLVNGVNVNIPSYRVRPGDIITLKPNKTDKILSKEAEERLAAQPMPSWLTIDAGNMTGKVTSLPEGEDLKQPFDATLIVEYYSR
jgi:small subunit ribosomal protein S4